MIKNSGGGRIIFVFTTPLNGISNFGKLPT
jgi:hypothetical protein